MNHLSYSLAEGIAWIHIVWHKIIVEEACRWQLAQARLLVVLVRSKLAVW